MTPLTRRIINLSFQSCSVVKNLKQILQKSGNIAIFQKYRNISKKSIFFSTMQYNRRYINIENDISIFSIYQVITKTQYKHVTNTYLK